MAHRVDRAAHAFFVPAVRRRFPARPGSGLDVSTGSLGGEPVESGPLGDVRIHQADEARVDGRLVWPPRGEAGFGYDPMFLPDGHDRTFGEMSSIEKHGLPPLGKGLSHRARAFVKLAERCLG